MESLIQNIEIDNFKSIHHAKLEDCRRINVLVGRPNVGKSNIIEALSLFNLLTDQQRTSLADLCRAKDYKELFFDGNTKAFAELSYNNAGRLRLQYNSKSSLTCFVPYGSVSFADISTSKLVLNFNSNLYSGGIQREWKPDFPVKKYVFKTHSTSEEQGSMIDTALVSPYGDDLEMQINEHTSVQDFLSDIFKEYGLESAIEVDGNNVAFRIIKRTRGNRIFLIPFHQVADTIQRLCFFKTAIVSNENTVLIFEEPEAHMHPPFIKLFTNDVIDHKSNQYFIATHSPYVLDELLINARNELAIYAVGYKDGETTINRLEDEEVEDVYKDGIDMFFNIESYV